MLRITIGKAKYIPILAIKKPYSYLIRSQKPSPKFINYSWRVNKKVWLEIIPFLAMSFINAHNFFLPFFFPQNFYYSAPATAPTRLFQFHSPIQYFCMFHQSMPTRNLSDSSLGSQISKLTMNSLNRQSSSKN